MAQANILLTYGPTLHTSGYTASSALEPGETLIYLPTPQPDSAFLMVRSDVPIRMVILNDSLPDSQDQVGLAITWDGPRPNCDSANPPLPSPPCWLGVAGAAPLVSHATVTWNNAVPFTVSSMAEGGQWLTTIVASSRACIHYSSASCSPQITLIADPSLPPGDYKATVTISAHDPTLLPASVAFVFRVTPSAISIVAPGYLWFSVNDSIYSRGPATIAVNSPAEGTPFFVKTREVQDFGWLSVTPMQGVTPAVLNIYVNPAPSQFAGIGYVDISGPSNTVTEPVNMVVPNPPQPANYVLTTSPSSLTFWRESTRRRT